MWESIERRVTVLYGSIQRRWWVKLAFLLWALGSFYDQIGAQFLPEDTAEKLPRIYEVVRMTTGFLPLWGWLIILLIIVIGALVESLARREPDLESNAANAATHDGQIRTRKFSGYEIEQKLRMIDSALVIMRILIRPTARECRVLLSEANSAFRQDGRRESFLERLRTYTEHTRNHRKQIENLILGGSEHEDVLSAVGAIPEDRLDTSSDGFRLAFEAAIESLSGDNKDQGYQIMVGPKQVAWDQVADKHERWANTAEQNLVKLRKEIAD